MFLLHICAVHRDIKPRNVLLSYSVHGGIRAIISDFGLCRKIPHNYSSYTTLSGVAGTDGWIAPEVISQNGKVVGHFFYFVDVSLFYMLSHSMLVLSHITVEAFRHSLLRTGLL